jgi:hypothetical protein
VPSKRKANVIAEETAAAKKLAASGKVLLTGDVNKTAAVKKSAESSYLKAKASEAVASDNPYPEVWGIRDAYKIFNLEDGGLSSEAIDHARRTVLEHIDRQRSRQLGYQCNMHINAEKFVSHYLDTSVCIECLGHRADRSFVHCTASFHTIAFDNTESLFAFHGRKSTTQIAIVSGG